MTWAGIAKFALGAEKDGIERFRQAIELNRNIAPAHFFLASALALTGAADDARSMAQAGLALDPTYTVHRYRAGAATDNPTYLSQRERICEGMRIAGVPEG
jgi:tetratricopeptide (TPR) repeat protein